MCCVFFFFLCDRYDPDTANFLPLVINGTLMYPMPGLRRLKEEAQQLIAPLDIKESDDGVFAHVDLAAKLKADLQRHLDKGQLTVDASGCVVGRDGKPAVVCWSFDACTVHRGMKQTSFGYKICNLINAPDNSPHYFHEYALMEAGDDYMNIKKHAETSVLQVNEILNANAVQGVCLPVPWLSPSTTKLQHVGCADQAALHSASGHGGCNMSHSCSYCLVHKSELCAFGFEENDNWEARTQRNAALLAHAMPGKCPGCECEITANEKFDPATERPVVTKLGEKAPKVPVRFKGIPHSTLHYNQKLGQIPLFNVAPSFWCICILHMCLRIVGMLFEYSVLRSPMLARKVKGKRRKKKSGGTSRAEDDTLGAHVWAMLTAAQIHIKMLTPPTADINAYYYSIKKHNFAGEDASKLMSVWRPILELVFYNAQGEQYDKHVAAWEQWSDVVWPLICDVTSEDALDRNKKAANVKVAGAKFVELWVAMANDTTHLYPHLLTSHLPDQIRNMPVDPFFLQLQSQESRHSMRKKWAFTTNKHAPRSLEDRIIEIKGYWRNGKLIKGGKRNIGVGRNFQILKRSLLHDCLVDIWETDTSMRDEISGLRALGTIVN
jgi:hypothetical protein